MSTLSRLASTAAAAIALVISPLVSHAQGSGAHFLGDTTDSIADSGQLVVSIDEAGVGGDQVQYVVDTLALATYACINGGDHSPKASNKQTFSHGITGNFMLATAGGHVTATLTVDPVGPGDFTCPGGQQLVLASITYDDVALTDVPNGVTIDLPDVSRTFYDV